MPKMLFLRPIDQPTGKDRLINAMIDCLNAHDLTHFCFAVGFAKVGPLLRLLPHVEKWRSAGKTVQGIFGIDLCGTSFQALGFAVDVFDKAFITYVPNNRSVTFHPKIYVFFGDERAVCFLGSHNLTVGGTETNFEGGIRIELDRRIAEDEAVFQDALSCWTSLLPDECTATRVLDKVLLDAYFQAGLLLDERQVKSKSLQTKEGTQSERESVLPEELIPYFDVKPPSSLPKESLPGVGARTVRPQAKKTKQEVTVAVAAGIRVPSGQRLVIQIVPHHNGEIFLSKFAINQNPEFFGYPFTGLTIPKIASNPSYPQRVPDPVVNIRVFDQSGALVTALGKSNFNLNMVYYNAKSEIRITVPPTLAHNIEPFSILVMSRIGDEGPQDYDMDIYLPGSNRFSDYLAVCNQTLPSGGAMTARKMGWL